MGEGLGHKRKLDEDVESDRDATDTQDRSSSAFSMNAGLGHKRKAEEDGEDHHEDTTTSHDPSSSPSPSAPSQSTSPSDPTSSPAAVPSSSIGARLLQKAGYRGSGGLGRKEQGIAAPLADSNQLFTHGIGFQTTVKRQRHDYNLSPHIQIVITPHYLSNPLPPLTSIPLSNLQIQPHDDNLITCPLYSSLSLQTTLLECKSSFDHVDPRSFLAARSRANPFELLRSEMFQNRAALKMAEVDRITDRLLTQRSSSPSTLLSFADICAGPGGFTEYMLTRAKWRGKGFGFTLRGNLDFRTEKFNSNAPAHSFRAYYGVDGTGDITRSDNIRSFCAEVWKEGGVEVVMGDGGFEVVGEENKQELRSQQLILCECITALGALREGGSFVCKLFDCFLPFTVSVLWWMRRCFDDIAIVKPNQSRPANSERYLVAKGKKANTDAVLDFLYQANDRINQLNTRPTVHRNKSDRRAAARPDPVEVGEGEEVEMAVVSLVPKEVIAEDEEFVAFIRQSNDALAERQIAGLQRLMRYVEDVNLPSDDQEEVRKACLQYWQITDQREHEQRREAREHKRRRAEAEEDTLEAQEGEEEEDAPSPGYIHYDPAWNFCHFSRYPQQGFFSLQGVDRLHADLLEQLRSVQALEPMPTSEERDAYRKRRYTASSVKQLHSFCDHSWSCIVVPTGGVHSFLLASSSGVFVMDDRGQLMPLPSSYGVKLPPDTTLECVLYPTSVVIIDVWSLPSPPQVFPTHRTQWMHRRKLRERMEQARLLVEAMRMGREGGVMVGEVKEWGEVIEVREGEDDVLVVREEASRPCAMR